MQLIIKFFEVKGWPRMSVENLITNNGDGIRLQNWAMDRRRDFAEICKEHANATELARQAVAQGRTSRAISLRNMFETIFANRKGEYQPPERGTVQNTEELRNKALEFIKGYAFNDSKQVYTNGSDLVPLFRVEHMLDMMRTGDFNYYEA